MDRAFSTVMLLIATAIVFAIMCVLFNYLGLEPIYGPVFAILYLAIDIHHEN